MVFFDQRSGNPSSGGCMALFFLISKPPFFVFESL